MLTKYFKAFNKKMVKEEEASKTKAKANTKAASKTTTKKIVKKKKIDLKNLKDVLDGIVPSELIIGSEKPVDSSGYVPEGASLIAYREYCRDIGSILDGYIPYELIHGAFFVNDKITKDTMKELLSNVINLKKLNFFAQNADEGEANYMPVPSFVIASDMDMSFTEIKDEIVDYYMTNNIESNFEVDIIVVINKGIVVKNWRESRNYIALETNEDTSMWFFVLMNEYLTMDRGIEMDFRNYIKSDVVYKEY